MFEVELGKLLAGETVVKGSEELYWVESLVEISLHFGQRNSFSSLGDEELEHIKTLVLGNDVEDILVQLAFSVGAGEVESLIILPGQDLAK